MALLKSHLTKHGIEANYWRIGILNNHPRSNSVQVVLDWRQLEMVMPVLASHLMG